ncbi:MAG: flagellar export chaperone FliS [Spirochaetaceae bacterium]|nr:flagellar export chaperone FliS [Spirochaetaceae bacterium]
MAYPQAFNAYKNASVTTASSGQLVVMLYDEVVKQLTLAMSLFDENGKVPVTSVEKYNAHIIRAQDIITELMVSLDMVNGGDIAKNLMNLYVYFNQELMEGNLKRDTQKLLFVKSMMSDLRGTWAEISSRSGSAVAPEGMVIDG